MKGTKARATMLPKVRDGKPWPRRLESREAVTVFGDLRGMAYGYETINRAFVGLASGEQLTGKSPALKVMRELVNKLRNEVVS